MSEQLKPCPFCGAKMDGGKDENERLLRENAGRTHT